MTSQINLQNARDVNCRILFGFHHIVTPFTDKETKIHIVQVAKLKFIHYEAVREVMASSQPKTYLSTSYIIACM